MAARRAMHDGPLSQRGKQAAQLHRKKRTAPLWHAGPLQAGSLPFSLNGKTERVAAEFAEARSVRSHFFAPRMPPKCAGSGTTKILDRPWHRRSQLWHIADDVLIGSKVRYSWTCPRHLASAQRPLTGRVSDAGPA